MMVCDKLHIICGNCGQDLTEKNMASYDVTYAEENAPYCFDVFISCKNCETIHNLRQYMEEE